MSVPKWNILTTGCLQFLWKCLCLHHEHVCIAVLVWSLAVHIIRVMRCFTLPTCRGKKEHWKKKPTMLQKPFVNNVLQDMKLFSTFHHFWDFFFIGFALKDHWETRSSWNQLAPSIIWQWCAAVADVELLQGPGSLLYRKKTWLKQSDSATHCLYRFQPWDHFF